MIRSHCITNTTVNTPHNATPEGTENNKAAIVGQQLKNEDNNRRSFRKARKMNKDNSISSATTYNRRSYVVIVREALEKFKGRKRSRKYVLKEDNNQKPSAAVIADDTTTHFVNKYNFAEKQPDVLDSNCTACRSENSTGDNFDNAAMHYSSLPAAIDDNRYTTYQMDSNLHQKLQLPNNNNNENKYGQNIDNTLTVDHRQQTTCHVTNLAPKHRNHEIKKHFTSPLRKRKHEVSYV